MKSKKHFLAIALLLFSSSVLAASMPTVTINGKAILTFPDDTSIICRAELKQQGCTGSGCSVGGKTFSFTKCTSISLTFQGGSGSCTNTQAELYLSTANSTYNVSLVNGYNVPVSITGGATPVSVNSKTDITQGAYPYGCSLCTSRTSADCGYDSLGSVKGCSKAATCQITYDTSKAYTVTFGS